MYWNLLRGGAISCALLTCPALYTQPAIAQAIGDGRPLPRVQAVDRMGVDLRSGRRTTTDGVITIGGSEEPALSYSVGAQHGSNVPLWGYVTLNCIPSQYYACSQRFYSFDMGDRSEFQTGHQSSSMSDGSQLETTAQGWNIHDKGGSVWTFTKITGAADQDRQGYLTSLRRPNGEVYTYHYPAVPSAPANTVTTQPTVRSITTTSGYQMHIELSSSGRRVTLINRAYFSCDPLALSCTDPSRNWPTVFDGRSYSSFVGPNGGTVTLPGRTVTYSTAQQGSVLGTDNRGRTIYAYSQNVTSGAGISTNYEGRWNNGYFYPPEWGGNGCAGFFNITRVTTAVGSWNYSYQLQNGCPGGSTTVTAPDGSQVMWSEGYDGGQPIETLTDEIGRATRYAYSTSTWPTSPYTAAKRDVTSITYPEGNRATFTYDARRNLVASTRMARPGSSEGPLTWTWEFPTTCSFSTARTCNQPLGSVDARGNRTDFTYSPDHGGLLTETKPAVSGIRPQIRHEYAQRYARISDGAGGHVQAPTSIWVRVATSTCRTSAATGNISAPCATAGDEVRTTYDYGLDSGPNNLLVRGIAVTADGTTLRTCYQYDVLGRRISQTSPGAQLSQCS